MLSTHHSPPSVHGYKTTEESEEREKTAPKEKDRERDESTRSALRNKKANGILLRFFL